MRKIILALVLLSLIISSAVFAGERSGFDWKNLNVDPFNPYEIGSEEGYQREIEGLLAYGESEQNAKFLADVIHERASYKDRYKASDGFIILKPGDTFDHILFGDPRKPRYKNAKARGGNDFVLREDVTVRFDKHAIAMIFKSPSGKRYYRPGCGNLTDRPPVPEKKVIEAPIPPPPPPPPPPPEPPKEAPAAEHAWYKRMKADCVAGAERMWYRDGTKYRSMFVSTMIYPYVENEDGSGVNAGLHHTYSNFTGNTGGKKYNFNGYSNTFGLAVKVRDAERKRDWCATLGYQKEIGRGMADDDYGRFYAKQTTQKISSFAGVKDYSRDNKRWFGRNELFLGIEWPFHAKRNGYYGQHGHGLSQIQVAPDNRKLVTFGVRSDILTLDNPEKRNIQLCVDLRYTWREGDKAHIFRGSPGLNLLDDSFQVYANFDIGKQKIGNKRSSIFGIGPGVRANAANFYWWIRNTFVEGQTPKDGEGNPDTKVSAEIKPNATEASIGSNKTEGGDNLQTAIDQAKGKSKPRPAEQPKVKSAGDVAPPATLDKDMKDSLKSAINQVVKNKKR